VGTEKRERQKSARIDKIVAEQAAAKRARNKRTAFRVVAAAVVVIGGLFAYTVFFGDDDDDETATGDETEVTTTSVPEAVEPVCDNPAVAAAVGREAPDTEPPPEDTAADALDISTLVEGQGDGAVAGDTVVVHYVGKTADGATFDCSWDASGTGESFPVTLGQGMVIPGWDEGLIGAKAGERRHLVIGSENAYGAEGSPPVIPPDAPLAFDVDILEVQKAGTTTTPPSSTP
jgi:FKBP-type peptidyl-prolyl cis-trans isomerase